MKNKIGRKVLVYIFCLIVSFASLLFITKSSPLYSMNDWCDANVFFTIGKGTIKGMVPYKDLFEQKGPILYFLHSLGYLISNTSFLGIFVLEVISFSIFLYFISKTMQLFCDKKNIIWEIPLISFVILSSFVFVSGDSAEEFCIPLLSVSLYYFLKYIKNMYPNKLSAKVLIINGIMAGCILWIKYTMLGFWIGFILFIFIAEIINKRIKNAVMSCVYFLVGMLITSCPILIYFGINNAIKDLFYNYFYINMTMYSEKIFIIKKILLSIKSCIAYSLHLPVFLILSASGYSFLMINKKVIPNIYGKIAITVTLIITASFIYFGNNYQYYFLFLMPFCVMGIMTIGVAVDKYLKLDNKIYYSITTLLAIAFVVLACVQTPNIKDIKQKKEDNMAYTFSQYINSEQDKTLLNYHTIDVGCYLYTDTIPTVKYFFSANIDYPEMENSQKEYIKTKRTNFVLVKLDSLLKEEDVPYLKENYLEIANYQQKEDGELIIYKLFKRNN